MSCWGAVQITWWKLPPEENITPELGVNYVIKYRLLSRLIIIIRMRFISINITLYSSKNQPSLADKHKVECVLHGLLIVHTHAAVIHLCTCFICNPLYVYHESNPYSRSPLLVMWLFPCALKPECIQLLAYKPVARYISTSILRSLLLCASVSKFTIKWISIEELKEKVECRRLQEVVRTRTGLCIQLFQVCRV